MRLTLRESTPRTVASRDRVIALARNPEYRNGILLGALTATSTSMANHQNKTAPTLGSTSTVPEGRGTEAVKNRTLLQSWKCELNMSPFNSNSFNSYASTSCENSNVLLNGYLYDSPNWYYCIRPP